MNMTDSITLTPEQQWEQAFIPAFTVTCDWCGEKYQQTLATFDADLLVCPSCEEGFEETLQSLEWLA